MAKYELKTMENDASVEAFLQSVAEDNPQRVEDARVMMAMMAEATGEPAKMWGKSIIGFGRYHYKYDSGHEGDSHLIGLSPRKANLSLYIMPGYGKFEKEINDLGKVKVGKSCVYIKKLDQIDHDALKHLIEASVAFMREKYGV